MYKLRIVVALIMFALCINALTGQRVRNLKNPIFVFNNALNKQDLPAMSYAEQALFLKKLGFDGMEYKETAGILDAIGAFKKQGIKIYTDYLKIDIDQKESYLLEWKQLIPKLKGTGIVLWVHLHSKKYKPSDEGADEVVVPILKELADFANPYGVRLAIYHHVGFLAEKVEDSYRLALKVNRQNVGSVFNLCHFLKTDSEENLEKVLNLTLPKLFAVSISGADGGDTKNMDWDRLIQPLGKGTFDVYSVVEMLADKGYQGPIGIQCYNIKGSPEIYLKQSSDAWKTFKQKYSIPVNSISSQEKTEGWELLFDGKSTKKWRGINQNSFPKDGWKVENGELCIVGNNVLAESENAGDIITKKMYGNFELIWDWKMLTKGGNSGVKYFVLEGISDNPKHGEGLEYQLLDDMNHPWMLEGKMKPGDYRTLASLYEIIPATNVHPNPLGIWNQSKIVCKGNHVEHWLNGIKVLDYERGSDDYNDRVAKSKMASISNFGMAEKGHILLQDHGSILHFRNIKIK